MVRMAFLYVAFGLTLSSTFEIPELDPASGDAQPDFHVAFGTGEAPVGSAHCPLGQVPASTVVLSGPARAFRITRGSLIEVWESDPATRDLTRAALMGFAFSVVVYQRGLWPLHVGAIRSGNSTWLFGGRSGAGKSTIVSWLHTHLDLPIVTDDAAVVRLEGTGVQVSVASRAVRLFPESYERTFLDADTGLRTAVALPAIDRKIRVRIQQYHASHEAPVAGLILLDDLELGERATVTRLHGAEAFLAIQSTLFRPWLGGRMYSAPNAVRFCAELLRRLPIYRYARSRSFDLFTDNLGPLLSLMQVEVRNPAC